MQHLKENPTIGNSQLQPMYNFAKAKHDATGAIRKHSGHSYWEHPSGVADIAAAYGGTDVEIQAALAHDTLEDTSTTYDELCDKFGTDVADIVSEVTNDNGEIAKTGKENYIDNELCTISHPALFVKLCDIYYNTKDFPNEEQRDRMICNVEYLLRNRDDLESRELDLIDAILTGIDDSGEE